MYNTDVRCTGQGSQDRDTGKVTPIPESIFGIDVMYFLEGIAICPALSKVVFTMFHTEHTLQPHDSNVMDQDTCSNGGFIQQSHRCQFGKVFNQPNIRAKVNVQNSWYFYNFVHLKSVTYGGDLSVRREIGMTSETPLRDTWIQPCLEASSKSLLLDDQTESKIQKLADELTERSKGIFDPQPSFRGPFSYLITLRVF
jgi:hypothetical protein